MVLSLERPTYKNEELEKIIEKNKMNNKVTLAAMGLNSADMQIVGYYLLQENKVMNFFHKSIRVNISKLFQI